MSVLQKMALATTGAGQLTLGDAFDVKFGRRAALSIQLNNKTQDIKDEIIKKKSNTEIEKIEEALNNFYSTEDEEKYSNYKKELKEKMLEEITDTMIQKIQNASIDANYLSDADFKSVYSGNANATGFQLQKISNMIAQAHSQIEKFEKTVSTLNLERIKDGIAQMENLQSQLLSLVQQYNTGGENSIIKYNSFSISKRSQVMSLLKTIYLLYEAIDNRLTVEDWEVIERAIAEMNRHLVNGAIEEAEELVKKSLTGSQRVPRKSGSTIEVSTNSSVSSLKQYKGYKTTGQKATITVSPYNSKQGKMDVQMYWNEVYGGTEADYRVSAKRWYGKSKTHSLGVTSILGAIARSANDVGWVNAYSLGLLVTEDQFKWNEGKISSVALQEAHQLAKISLLADIGMGISQDFNYANLLIIDHGGKFKVYSLSDIIIGYLNGQQNNRGKVYISGYNEGKLEQAMASIYKNKIRRLGRTNTNLRSNSYLALAQMELDRRKVSIRFRP